jgi:cysteine desulfurase / selenocysteine lyase
VLAGRDAIEVGKALNEEGIVVRAGHRCAQPTLRRLGLEQTVRPSLASYNTDQEVDELVDAVRRVASSPEA